MKYIPKGLTRVASRQLLKLNGASPTILVVGGVVGLGVTAVMAAKATRHIDPILDAHRKDRIDIDSSVTATTSKRDYQKAILRLYVDSAANLTKLYGPTLVVGVVSAGSILSGHKILHGRHVATMAAYSGLFEQFQSYRGRVSQTLGEAAERDIYDGAHGEWKEDLDHKGEYKLQPTFSVDETTEYLRPWFDERNPNWTRNAEANYLFLKSVQAHLNHLLSIRGHLFLNEAYDALRIPRCKEGQVVGWIYEDRGNGDGYIDLGFMTSQDPHSIAFRNSSERTVRLNINADGVIWDKLHN